MTNVLATGAYTTVNNGATADTNQIIKFTTNQLSSGAFTTVGNIATLSSNTIIGMAGAAVGGSNYVTQTLLAGSNFVSTTTALTPEKSPMLNGFGWSCPILKAGLHITN